MRAKVCRNFPFPIFFDDRAGRAAFATCFDEFVAVEIFAAQRDKQFARLIVRESVLTLSMTTDPSPEESEAPANLRNLRNRKRIHGAKIGDRTTSSDVGKFENSEIIILKLHRMIFHRAARDLDVVERHGVIGELLIIFVAFAGDQNDVARLRQLDGAANRFCAIGNFLVAIRAKAFFDLGQ